MEPLDSTAPSALTRPPIEVDALVRRTRALLEAGVPLTLLLDLAEASGPRSTERYRAEPADLSWLTPRSGG